MRSLLLTGCALLALAPGSLLADPDPPGIGTATEALPVPITEGCILALNETTLQVKCLRNDCGQPCTKVVVDIPGTDLQEIHCDTCPGATTRCDATVIFDTVNQQATLQCGTVLCPEGARCQVETVDGWSFCACQ